MFGLCLEQLEKRVLETALFSLFSARENNWKNVCDKLRCFSYLVPGTRENNWKNVCYKLRCFPYSVLAKIMKGGKYSYFVLA